MTHRAFLGLGSNIGDRVAYLRDATALIPDVVAMSDAYETDPIGGPAQGAFLNIVVRLDTDLSARQLLGVCQERESAAERVRVVHWGPRSLDVDVLWVDGETVDEPDLIVPHARMFERAFVLVPLADVGGDLLPEGYDVAIAARTEGVRNVGPLESLA
ncbi:MAG: 2-amino-4-hydroxy-6-hydroxymethyldihydropteridine diphosphokinase [Acidimicrobiaceae bacterium]|jgi:2-amino-4-hydroxy-6-hydroxymethyldihydropteridine diphosphokinase|nr:2-amino-4-hydroxy-6-hydroxymethyldihydropteridine diphosphokinase [Acidimicrobiaceae bacterium]MBT5582283.1 2-amino-4-hydroxy-6-hydroxymethyldihydropteridine diphosphokinase [Acidimicrobiaceae bacterium]MBT5851692.1 2-amino-4-hydroxy-6-hydroxymethyldihydropteridine diphosphokinase [Acidimicrobiaceae bacterium]